MFVVVSEHTHHSHAAAVAADAGKVEEKAVEEVEGEHTELHTWIGVALVLGFIFMLIVDQIGGGLHHHAPSGMSLTSAYVYCTLNQNCLKILFCHFCIGCVIHVHLLSEYPCLS